jgi:hypothetical protein
VPYSISIAFVNSFQAQDSPHISLCATAEAGDYDAIIECSAMEYDDGHMIGVASARNPLRIFSPAISSEIGHT